MNEQNLIKKGSFAYNRELARSAGRAGSQARKINNQKRKTFKELAQLMLSMKAPKMIKEKIKEVFPEITDNDMTSKLAMLYVQYSKALKGDWKAFEILRDTGGEKPVDKQEITGENGVPLIPPVINYIGVDGLKNECRVPSESSSVTESKETV